MKTTEGYHVRTFATELKIFHTMKELEALDDQVNRFIMDQDVEEIVSVSDATTQDNTGATIGLIRVLTYKT
jgi:hypothetical protein